MIYQIPASIDEIKKRLLKPLFYFIRTTTELFQNANHANQADST